MKHKLQAMNTCLIAEATLNPEHITGAGGHVFPRLMVPLSLYIKEEPSIHSASSTQAISYDMLTGDLVVGTEKIGDIQPVSVARAGMQHRPYQDEIHQQMEISLDPRRIERLEQVRAGKSMEGKLRISLTVQVFGAVRDAAGRFTEQVGLTMVSSIKGEISFTISDTHWREHVLPALGYGRVIAIELPAISLDACKALEHSFKALEKARRHFENGLYDDAAGACRVAMDPFFEQVDKGDKSGKTIPKLKKGWEVKLGQATYDWLDAALSAIKAAANKPHHSPNNHFDRLGAQMLLMVTTALVACAARSIDATGEKP